MQRFFFLLNVVLDSALSLDRYAPPCVPRSCLNGVCGWVGDVVRCFCTVRTSCSDGVLWTWTPSSSRPLAGS